MTRHAWIPAVLLALSCQATKAPPAPSVEPAESIAPDEPLPFDPAVRAGVLDNGLRYFIETNGKPEQRAVFRLVVDAGSVLEDPDQLGLAHFVEHMAFNGTTHFEGNELIRYLEQTGTRFGAHLNAHTSFDETVYKLQVATDDPELFDKAFLILEDWAHGLRFDPEEVEKERGVVLEEWRRSLGPGHRARQVIYPVLWAGSPYPERFPIGTEESLLNFTRDAAVRFYEDWYRPDLMALVVVGDFDPDAVESKIVEHFSRIEAPEDPRERIRPDVPDREEPAWIVFTDPELTRTQLTVETGHDWRREATYREYRDGFVQQVFFSVLRERYSDLTRDPEGPLLSAAPVRTRRTPTEGGWRLSLTAREGRVLDAYELALVELERIRRHGVTEAELARARASIQRNMQRYYNERHTTDSVVHAEELVRHYTTGESVPGIELEWELTQEYLPTITAEEVQAFARDVFLPDPARVVTVQMPAKDELVPPAVADLQAVEEKVAAMEIAPPSSEETDAPLLADLPEPGVITARRTEEAVGFEVWTLSNGAEVWVKPTDFEAEEILFRGRSLGGYDRVSDEDYVAAATATDLMRLSGLGALESPALRKRLAGHRVGVQPWISGTHEGLTGSAAPEDLELLLQLTWLTFTEPRFDADALELSRRNRAEGLRNRFANPRTPFLDARNKLIWQDFPRFRPWTEETLASMDLERARAFYADRFGDASDWRFVFVGSFDPADLEPLVTRYLASLPAPGRAEPDDRFDLGARRITGRHEQTVYSGTEPQAEVSLVLHGTFESTFLHRNRLAALREVLSTRLREVLREDKGGVYGVSVGVSDEAWPQARYAIEISFVCDPERVEELEAAVHQVLAEMRAGPVDPHYVQAYQQKSLRSRQESLQRNRFWADLADGVLDVVRLTGETLDEAMQYEERVMSLTPEALHAFAADVLDTENVITVRRLPAPQQ